MKKILFLIPFFIAINLLGQTNTEVYLFDLSYDGVKLTLSNKKNISNNEGYDNQPSFYDNNTVLFSSTRNGQTDVKQYIISNDESTWLTDTSHGSEYSPQRIADSKDISAVRLDTSGLQRLYEYKIKSGKSKPVLNDAKIGYYTWFDKDVLANTQLNGNSMDLVISNLKSGVNFKVQNNVGRSVLKIPGKNEISFVSQGQESNQLWALDPVSGQAKGITNIKGVNDFYWLSDGTLLGGAKNKIIAYNAENSSDWKSVYAFDDPDLQSISRIAISPSGDKMVVVSEVSSAYYIDKQLEAYNSRNIDAFVATYSDKIALYNFPNELISEGKEALRSSYDSFFQTTPDLNCTIKNRTIMGNKVVDTEYLTMNGENFTAMAVYEVENGKIVKVTFIR